jgi:ribosomal protein L11 methyltransferase
MLGPEQSLYVYELRGGVVPAYVELDGLLGIWPEADYTYLFFTSPADDILQAFLAEHPQFNLTHHYRLSYGQWQQLAVHEPIVLDRFKIITRQQAVDLSPGEILLHIDPGVMFGSGLHPTTRGCLRALSLLYSETKPSRVLDLGTGTGILAVAAAKLGAREVDALDLNPMAISTAAVNCDLNEVGEIVRLLRGDAREQLARADLLCVNIHFDFLETFLSGSTLYNFRWAIMSGFLKEKLVRVRNLLPSSVVVKEPVIEEEGWITLTLEIKER